MTTHRFIRALLIVGFTTAGGLAVAQTTGTQTPTKPEKPKLPAAERKKGRSILEKSNEAVIAVKSAKYEVEAVAGTPLNPSQVVATGKSKLSGLTDTGFDRFQFDGQVDARTAKQTKNVVVSSDGKQYFLVDHTEKTYIRSDKPEQLGLIPQVVSIALMIEFTHPEPFRDELNGRVELTDYETIHGVECYVLSVTYRRGGGTAEWTVGKEDYLPRRVRRRTGGVELEQQVSEMTLKGLVVNEELPDSEFQLDMPAGYQEAKAVTPEGPK
ncbi:MAG: DUF2092 domain-containing protein [Phycisphaerae bacterium]